ncbi:MAG: glycosyltransferase family 4 protein [Promethearchaeota archaeon]
MKILHVIHGFPPEYMAGSEVYTYNLCKTLSKKHDITVFYRISNPYLREYEVEETTFKEMSVIKINLPNIPHVFEKRYKNPIIDEIFEQILQRISPDLVHISHLNYLSTTIIKIIKKHNFPIIYTLHDYWLMCPRGQLIQLNKTLCPSINFDQCGECLLNYFLDRNEAAKEMKRRENYIQNLIQLVDIFIAPSNFLREKYINWGVTPQKIIYADYGFDTKYFKNFQKKPSDIIRFGYIGRIIPVKGVDLIIKAFNLLKENNIVLKIYGRNTPGINFLKDLCQNSHVKFMGSYNNWDIARVLSEIDVIIVPSIWYENSPLVIHEAFLANIPVITSNAGGMAELIENRKNGLLFKLGDVQDLTNKIQVFLDDPSLINKYGKNVPPVKTIKEDANFISSLYNKLINEGN